MLYHKKVTCKIGFLNVEPLELVLADTHKIQYLYDDLIVNLNLNVDKSELLYLVLNKSNNLVATRNEMLSDIDVKDGDYVVFM